jgi:hypothetical protein
MVELGREGGMNQSEFFRIMALRGPYKINHVAQNCFAQHEFAHSRSSQSAPYTINHVAQHAMLRNMIDRVWATLRWALNFPGSKSDEMASYFEH